MAVSNDTMFGAGSVTLNPTVAPVEFNKFAKDASPKCKVGMKVEDGEGNVYRYAHFGADTSQGKLVAADFSGSGVVDTDNAVIAPASTQNTGDNKAGSKYVEITLASVLAGQYRGGKFITTDDTGKGYSYDIVGNTATNDPTTGNIRIQLKQSLAADLAADTDAAIIPSSYSNLIAAIAATDAVCTGVSCANMDVSEAAYGWIQTKGTAAILQDGAIALGDPVQLSDGVAGAVQIMGGGASVIADLIAEQIIGTCIISGDDTGYGGFKFNLE